MDFSSDLFVRLRGSVVDLGKVTEPSLELLLSAQPDFILAADPDYIFVVLQGADPTDAMEYLEQALLVPHIMRRLVGEESLPLLLGCALGGAAMLTGCDLLARLLFAPYVLPVGIVLSLLGGPFFIWLLLRQRGGRIHD